MCDKDIILKAKEQWSKSGFTVGILICNFILMQEMKLDIAYDETVELVKEYRRLLEKQLDTDNFSLLMMANTEIEMCYMDEKEEVYEYLCDEIYEHFKNSNKSYPLQAVGLHIDVITALVYLDEGEKAFRYLRILKETYKNNFGDESYLFCRNWCYLLNEVLMEFIPEVAIEEFMDSIDLFSTMLKEDEILYCLYMNIAIKRTNQKQKISYIKEAIDLCEIWCKDISIEKQREIQVLIRGVAAMYHRNIGEYTIAIKMYEEVIGLTNDIHYKLFLLAQIANILYIKHDLKRLNQFFEDNGNLMETLQDSDENVAELHNIYGAYYMQMGNYHEALIQIERAIGISERILGNKADATIKFKCNKLSVEYNSGEFDKASVQMLGLLNDVSENVNQYPESLPFILNNLIAMSFEMRVNSSTVLKMKKVVDSKKNKYDIVSNIVLKCNLYCIMMASGNSYDENIIEDLRKELYDYFTKYPYAEGYFVYLKGEFCRQCQGNSNSSEYKVLKKIEEYLGKINLSIISREYVTFFVVKLKRFIYKKEYAAARSWLLSVWDVVMLPLFKTLINRNEENMKGICLLLRSYISLFISSAQQYTQLQITDKELYEFVLNFKYVEDLLYCNKAKFNLVVKRGEWLSVNNIELSREKLIIECFIYTKYDMEDSKVIFGAVNDDVFSAIYQICFGLELTSNFLPQYRVEVISDIKFVELTRKMMDMFEEEISQIEILMWNRLQKFITKKEKIYVCNDIYTIQIPLAAMRISKKQYWGEIYQIIYCNTGRDVKDDTKIQDISNSIYFGVSIFGNSEKESTPKIQRQLYDLPYTELEVEMLSELTGGKVYLDEEVLEKCFNSQKREIVHFATHTIEDNGGGGKALVIGKDSDGQYIILKGADVAKLDWKEVKLVVLSACETREEIEGDNTRNSLNQAVKKAGALFSISTVTEVEDGTNSFFMICLYKNLLKYKKICRAFFEAQKIMRTITKKEIMSDADYLDIGMDYYLQNYEDDSVPFELIDDWAVYTLQMN